MLTGGSRTPAEAVSACPGLFLRAKFLHGVAKGDPVEGLQNLEQQHRTAEGQTSLGTASSALSQLKMEVW